MPQQTLTDYEIGLAVTGTGTVATSVSSAVVTGTGTSFLSTYFPGYLIIISTTQEKRVVLTVGTNTSLTVTANFGQATSGSGHTAVGLKNLQSLATSVYYPKSRFIPFSKTSVQSDGAARGLGFSVVTWTWGFLTQEQRDQLRTFCSGKSREVYIRTRTNEGSSGLAVFKYYKAIMIWPDEEEYEAARREAGSSSSGDSRRLL